MHKFFILSFIFFILGCDPQTSDRCRDQAGDGLTITASITTSAPLLLLKPLSGADQFSAGNTHARIHVSEPLLALGVPPDACIHRSDPYSYGSGSYTCERLHIGDLNAQIALQTITVDGQTQYGEPIPNGVMLSVLGRWNPGDIAQIDNLNAWARVYLVRLDALSYPNTPPAPKTLSIDATVEVKSCSVLPPYEPSRWPGLQAQSVLSELAGSFCGDGLVGNSACDDGNDDPDDGCERGPADLYGNVSCALSPMRCLPDQAGTWLAWRCEGAPSTCTQISCTLDSPDPACRDRSVSHPTPSPLTSATLHVVVNGRTFDPLAEHRGQILMSPEGPTCACTESGLLFTCNLSCTWNEPCALPRLDPSSALSLSRWEGCDSAPQTSACFVGNLTHSPTINAILDLPSSGEIAPRLPLPINTDEALRRVLAVAPGPDNASWAAIEVYNQKTYIQTPRLLYISSPDAQPLALPLAQGTHSAPNILQIAPSTDGQSAWILSELQGQASFSGQPIEPPLTTTATRRVATHITTQGDLLGTFIQGQEYDIADSQTQVAVSRTQNPLWSALLAFDDPPQSELILTALDPTGRKVWQRTLRANNNNPLRLKTLLADPSDHLWIALDADGPLSDATFPELAAQSGPLLLKLSPEGDLVWWTPWRVTGLAVAADGVSLWVLGTDPADPFAFTHLRLYDSQGNLSQDLDLRSHLTAEVGLWPQPGGDLILSRLDALGGLVLSRWQVNETLQRLWIERLDRVSHNAPVALASSETSIRVLSDFSTTEGPVLSLTLSP